MKRRIAYILAAAMVFSSTPFLLEVEQYHILIISPTLQFLITIFLKSAFSLSLYKNI